MPEDGLRVRSPELLMAALNKPFPAFHSDLSLDALGMCDQAQLVSLPEPRPTPKSCSNATTRPAPTGRQTDNNLFSRLTLANLPKYIGNVGI